MAAADSAGLAGAVTAGLAASASAAAGLVASTAGFFSATPPAMPHSAPIPPLRMALLFGITICYYWKNVFLDPETMTGEHHTMPQPGVTAPPKIDGATIRRLREEKGLPLLHVATVVGVTTDTISRWENRRYPSIRPENAKKLAEALGVSLAEILEPDAPAATPNEPAETLSPSPPRSRRVGIGLALLLALTIGAVFLAWWFNARPPVKVGAVRILPSHAPVGLSFISDDKGLHLQVTGGKGRLSSANAPPPARQRPDSAHQAPKRRDNG